jgi:glycosyltransferase involved in cell wall biosynthesis
MRHDENGLLVPFADTDAFVKISAGLISDMKRVQRLRIAARQTVEALTWENIMGEMEAVLLDTVRKQGAQYVQPELSAATD